MLRYIEATVLTCTCDRYSIDRYRCSVMKSHLCYTLGTQDTSRLEPLLLLQPSLAAGLSPVVGLRWPLLACIVC